MRITSKGQVTIPADIRERAPHTEVDFEFDGKVAAPGPLRGQRFVEKAMDRLGQAVPHPPSTVPALRRVNTLHILTCKSKDRICESHRRDR
jgi:hypothetical protein